MELKSNGIEYNTIDFNFSGSCKSNTTKIPSYHDAAATSSWLWPED